MMNEMDKLIGLLDACGMNYKVIKDLFGYDQVILLDEFNERIADAVHNPMSYGFEEGLLEIMGKGCGLVEDDDVLGYLTAEQVFLLWNI